MATTTAIVAVGEAHPYGGGLSPTHLFELLEGDRAAWVLHDLAHPTKRKIIGLPSRPENIMRGLLGMIGVCVLDLPSGWSKGSTEEIEETVINGVSSFQNPFVAIGIALYQGSTLTSQLDLLKDMKGWQIDVFMPVWSRRRSPFSEDWNVSGDLSQLQV